MGIALINRLQLSECIAFLNLGSIKVASEDKDFSPTRSKITFSMWKNQVYKIKGIVCTDIMSRAHRHLRVAMTLENNSSTRLCDRIF